MYDTIIIGGGPGGAAAAVYAARKKLKTLLITESFGGQSSVSAEIFNWIGTKSISGADLAKNLEEHIRAYKDDIAIKMSERAEKTAMVEDGFKVTTATGSYEAKTLIVVTGSRRRKLGIPGEEKYNGKGVAYCSTCDAPVFAGQKVAVVGGGNAGLEAVQDLIPYASEIYLLEYSDTIKGDPVTLENIKKSKKFKEAILNAQTLEVIGDKFVTGLKYKDRISGEEKTLDVTGVFVEIGAVPNSEFLGNLVEKNKYGEVLINHKTAATSREGIWAAGDVTDEMYKQNNISAGDAVKAALSAYQYLLNKEKAHRNE
ncbi:MAG: FAD-dependent oxidoreductase [Candidatus Niyogibacteria bacterium]|nr:FAD-dependent oxidoreductase [Candidatus Niyogibacteria bacterium]